MARKIGGPEDDLLEPRITVDTDDFEIFAQDTKATHLMEQTNKLFTERYKSFVNLIKMNKRSA